MARDIGEFPQIALLPKITIDNIEARLYRIPTESPESDGTLRWDSTTLVLVRVQAAGQEGIGYSYTHSGAVNVIRETLAPLVLGQDVMSIAKIWLTMKKALRNVQVPGISSMALAAVDTSLWDLKARVLGLPLAKLFGLVRKGIPVYGSGGFTSYSIEQLQAQLFGWVSEGISRVKMKVGREPLVDAERVRAAREAIGQNAALFVDANGAYTRKQALAMAEEFRKWNVSWFEEPVSSNDLDGLKLLCERAPAGMDISAGEYGDILSYFQRMLSAGSVDVLQADVTRCGGYTGFFRVAALAEAFEIPLSAHTAPSLHIPVCCALPNVCHLEYFFDHVRIEQKLFENVQKPVDGVLSPDLSLPGTGLKLKRDALESSVAAGDSIS